LKDRLNAMGGKAGSPGIEHVFVLMLENRSFDHLLGFSDISGADALTGAPTKINGLDGTESNSFKGQTYTASPGADYRMPTDPGHEFPNVLDQLCGPAARYQPGGPYPAIDNSGFVDSYVASGGRDPSEVMKCFRAEQLPVLNAIAREFVVCDNWYASMPGPTWPNRTFVHAASSGGLDHSPTTAEIIAWETVDGFPIKNGTIFDALSKNGITRRLYGGDDFPMVAALKGIHLDDIRDYSLFAGDLAQAQYPFSYIFIEPSYDVLNDYRGGTSEHPLADITRGEALIKATYESIRNSAVWPTSLFIVTWDEHGGFFDHGAPPDAPAPGDTAPGSKFNRFGFTFERYGPRVPAIVVSPLIPKNLIDHRLYDHASIPATLEALFGLNALTERDAKATRLDSLITLQVARIDAPETLPAPADSGAVRPSFQAPTAPLVATALSRPADPANEGNLPAVIYAAMQQELDLRPDQRHAIVARVASIKTRADAMHYLAEVQAKVRPHRSGSAGR
jgi:phospholipase C